MTYTAIVKYMKNGIIKTRQKTFQFNDDALAWLDNWRNNVISKRIKSLTIEQRLKKARLRASE